LIIAIDGPGSAGKSTVAKLLAKELNITYIDTGAMYRAVALAVFRAGFGAGDEKAVAEVLDRIAVDVDHDPVTGEQRIYLDSEDVSASIRTPSISIGASDVSKLPSVRLRLVELQRNVARGRDVVMDGRDIGTYVFPDAEHKFYLTASLEVRARRRYLELKAKGEDVEFADIVSDLRYRDTNDSTRDFAPLAVAGDAVCIQTDDLTALEVAILIKDIVSGKSGERRYKKDDTN